MKAIGFNTAQRGDIILNTVAARSLKQIYPTAHFTLAIAPEYADMRDLFVHHPYIDEFHVYRSHDGTDQIDQQFRREQGLYDVVFNGTPAHTIDRWWMIRHQAEEVCLMNGLPIPSDIQCVLSMPNDVPDNKTFIGLQPFGGWQDWPNKKSFSLARANEVVAAIKALGFNVLQFGGEAEPTLEGATKFTGSYFDSMRHMLGCEALVTTDSGRCWAASAYSFPTLGLYSNSYYGPEYVRNIQPINPNARYLDADLVVNLPIDQIITTLKETIA